MIDKRIIIQAPFRPRRGFPVRSNLLRRASIQNVPTPPRKDISLKYTHLSNNLNFRRFRHRPVPFSGFQPARSQNFCPFNLIRLFFYRIFSIILPDIAPQCLFWVSYANRDFDFKTVIFFVNGFFLCLIYVFFYNNNPFPIYKFEFWKSIPDKIEIFWRNT